MRALLLLPLLAACNPFGGAGEGDETAVADACGAARYIPSIGRPLEAISLPRGENARVITPGSVVTQDFVPSRLNLHISDTGLIERVSCG